MPITISYNDFITQTGDMPSSVSQPYQYSGIKYSISDLDVDDRTIIFTNLPSGLKVVQTLSTEPFDSVFIDIESYSDYILMSSGSNDIWASPDLEIFQARYVPSAGFWAIGATGYHSPGCILTGAGSEYASILDITFEGVNIGQTTFYPSDGLIELNRNHKYTLDENGETFTNITFNQLEDTPWYATEVALIGESNLLQISGTSYSGSGSIISIPVGFAGIIKWQNNELITINGSTMNSYAPAPFEFLSEGFSWNSTVPNEIFSDYVVVADNVGNTGVAIIQLNTAATNGEQFTDLIPPLRKLYITFSDNP